MTPTAQVLPFIFTILNNTTGQIYIELPERFVRCFELENGAITPIPDQLYEVAETLLEARRYDIVRRLEITTVDSIYYTHIVRWKGGMAWVRAEPRISGVGQGVVPPEAGGLGGGLRIPGT